MMHSRALDRLGLLLVSLAIVVTIFAQDWGRVLADTKLDLVVNSGQFLRRAITMWDPIGEGGRLQNQAYGYLFPMGPVFALTDWVGVPAWIAQRVWESVIMVAAFVGMYWLARGLGVARFWPATMSGLAYVATPRVLAELTSNSAELLPTFVLPWVVLPLVIGAERGSPRRAASLSALALLFAGGTNAGATLAVLPIPLLWLLTRDRGRRRSALLRWWSLSVFLVSVWWAVPLALLSRYSPRFFDLDRVRGQHHRLDVVALGDSWHSAVASSTRPQLLASRLGLCNEPGTDHRHSLGSDRWPCRPGRALRPAPTVPRVLSDGRARGGDLRPCRGRGSPARPNQPVATQRASRAVP